MNRKQLKKACQPLPPEQVLENLRELYDEGSYDFEDHEANAVKAAINVLKLAWEETREPEHKCSGVTPSDIAVGGMSIALIRQSLMGNRAGGVMNVPRKWV